MHHQSSYSGDVTLKVDIDRYLWDWFDPPALRHLAIPQREKIDSGQQEFRGRLESRYHCVRTEEQGQKCWSELHRRKFLEGREWARLRVRAERTQWRNSTVAVTLALAAVFIACHSPEKKPQLEVSICACT